MPDGYGVDRGKIKAIQPWSGLGRLSNSVSIPRCAVTLRALASLERDSKGPM
jgi:hypothetical protein